MNYQIQIQLEIFCDGTESENFRIKNKLNKKCFADCTLLQALSLRHNNRVGNTKVSNNFLALKAGRYF